MLKLAYEEIPKHKSQTSERFEIPKVRGHIQGSKTVISNFQQIADTLRRPAEHLLKYILRELATPGELTKTALMMGAKVPASRINEKVQQYVQEFIICKECGKPDTKMTKEGSVSFIKCMACGAKRAVKSKIK